MFCDAIEFSWYYFIENICTWVCGCLVSSGYPDNAFDRVPPSSPSNNGSSIGISSSSPRLSLGNFSYCFPLIVGLFRVAISLDSASCDTHICIGFRFCSTAVAAVVPCDPLLLLCVMSSSISECAQLLPVHTPNLFWQFCFPSKTPDCFLDFCGGFLFCFVDKGSQYVSLAVL